MTTEEDLRLMVLKHFGLNPLNEEVVAAITEMVSLVLGGFYVKSDERNTVLTTRSILSKQGIDTTLNMPLNNGVYHLQIATH